MTPAERAVQANAEIDALREAYLIALKDFNTCRDQKADPAIQVTKLELAHGAAIRFFNKLENTIIECDVLFQTASSTWAQDLANSAVNVLESIAKHYEKIRKESSLLKTDAPLPSVNAYCAMQSAVARFNPDQVDELTKRFRALNLPVRGFENPTGLGVNRSSQSQSAPGEPIQPISPPKGWITAFVIFSAFLLGLLALLIANLPKLRQYGSEVVTVSAFVIVGLLAAAVVFGMLRSYAHITGQEFGIAFEAGGPAALLLILVGGGLLYGYKMREHEFNLVLYFHLDNDPSALVHKSGELYLFLNKREPFTITDGVCYLNRIDQRWNGQEVSFSFSLPGFSSALPTNSISLKADARLFIPVSYFDEANRTNLVSRPGSFPPFPLSSSTTYKSKAGESRCSIFVRSDGVIYGTNALRNDDILSDFSMHAVVILLDENTNELERIHLPAQTIRHKSPGKAREEEKEISGKVLDKAGLAKAKAIRIEIFGD